MISLRSRLREGIKVRMVVPHPATPFKIRNVKVRVVVPNPAGGWFDDMGVLDNLCYGRDAVVGKEEEADIWRLCGTLGLHDGIFNSTNGRLPMLQVSLKYKV